jgi:hypothetical protein
VCPGRLLSSRSTGATGARRPAGLPRTGRSRRTGRRRSPTRWAARALLAAASAATANNTGFPDPLVQDKEHAHDYLYTIHVGELEVWIERRGDGPDVLLIAGLGDPAEAWQPQLEGLSDRYHLTAFGQPRRGTLAAA